MTYRNRDVLTLCISYMDVSLTSGPVTEKASLWSVMFDRLLMEMRPKTSDSRTVARSKMPFAKTLS